MNARRCLVPLLALASGVVGFAVRGAERPGVERPGDAPDFARSVLPILSDRCFLCHGPDPTSRRAGLRLDVEEDARDSGVLEPDGELVARITDDDPNFAMPPPESHLVLSDAERDVLVRWVEAGAPWARHWAFEPLPAHVDVPEAGAGWARSPIDRFVAASHDAHGLVHAPPASSERWLRRVTFDLTGLPPTPEEVAAFAPNDTPEARAAVVDRLLANPAYGERMATPWLDVARYADSYGYQSDLLMTVWPYRDWVVRAWNDNLPYDDFVTWQVAGDLLPDATEDQRLATAFNRLHRMTNEGGSVEAEWRHASVVDRVETFGTAFLALTFGCARCHDHKFDPITQKEFYGLFAYFNSIDEWGTYLDSARIPSPSLQLMPDEEAGRRLGRLEALVDDARAEVAREREVEPTERFVQVEEGEEDELRIDELEGLVAWLDFDEVSDDGKLANRANPESSATLGAGNQLVTDADRAQVLKFDGDTAVNLSNLETTFTPLDDFSISLWVWVPKDVDDAVLVHRTRGTDVGFFGFDLAIVDRKIRARQTRFWPGNANAVESRRLTRGKWHHVVYVQLGTGLATDMAIYVDGQRRDTVVRDCLSKLPQENGNSLELGARFRDHGLRGGLMDELVVVGRALTRNEVFELRGSTQALLGSQGAMKFKAEFTDTWLAPSGPLERLRELRRAILEERTGLVEVPVMQELAEPRVAHVLARGEYDARRSKRNVAPRAVPAALGAADAPVDAPDRLALARWLTSPDHPLTSRVAVNRVWQTLFGRGLVESAEDFGRQGASPSHPELLDWLARRFVDSGWDTKALVREIVLSATYAQDSRVSAAARADDPTNARLARGPSGRLSAEMLRDTVLFTSGLLSPKVGGPPVRPYQPKGLWRENNTMSPGYVQDVGEGLWRRTLYTVVKRTAPLPNLIAFDRPMRESSCARREATSTPLQGLVLWNDPQFVEAARVLAERSLAEAPDDPIGVAFLRLAGRAPTAGERAALSELNDAELESFRANPDDARGLLEVGDRAPAESLEPASVAALTVVVQAVLGSDAVVMKR